MENFEKITKYRYFNLFWAPKWPKNWTYEAHILHASKGTCNEHVKQNWCGTSKNFLRKWPKTRILTYFGTRNCPKIRPLGPIFHTPLKALAMSVWSNNDVTPVKTFWESGQSPEFLLTLGSKMACKPDIIHADTLRTKKTSKPHIPGRFVRGINQWFPPNKMPII